MMTRIITLLVFLYAGGVMLFYSYILLTKKDNRLFRGFSRTAETQQRLSSLKEKTTHTAGRWLETVAILCAVTGILCFFFPAHTKIFAAVFGIILIVSMLLLVVFAKIVK